MSLILLFLNVAVGLSYGLQIGDEDSSPAIAWFNQMNQELKQLNHEAAQYAWDSSTRPTQPETVEKIIHLSVRKAHWERSTCSRGFQHRDFNASFERALHLLCRSPRNTDEEIGEIAQLLGFMQGIYTGAQICIDESYDPCTGNGLLWDSTSFRYPIADNRKIGKNASPKFAKSNKCLYGEPDLEEVMKTGMIQQLTDAKTCSTNQEAILSWAWQSWRLAVGPPIKESYQMLMNLMNLGAQRAGYKDIGEIWREELDIPNLRELVDRLWKQAKPLYQKLHAVVRHYVRNRFPRMNQFDEGGVIPAHLLGDMWSQNWEVYSSNLVPHSVDIEAMFRAANWTGKELVKRAEDFYSSMGLPMMTKSFWERSVFERNENVSKCHGTAANMYEEGDFRMIACAGNPLNDFYVVMHEMGHIEYYMLASQQPTIFQGGTNTAFHESIGDTMHLAAMSPLHLCRLGLLNSSLLAPEKEETINTMDYALLMKMALIRIPALPFSYVMDRYRWDLFEGSVDFEQDANNYFWSLLQREQGVRAPSRIDRTHLFDAAAKYHFPDNTPYVRYFLANLLSFQILEGLCRKSVYGKLDQDADLPMPLHRCDLYGSKRAGKLLKAALQPGASQHWTVVLRTLTGTDQISAAAMFKYFDPLMKLLDRIIERFEIPVGW
ncbi:angiotensin-converting enzyme-like [Uranotaenia lowii]|uniref:angiotensin-converting enzyme-like n=1 Tax=Uranotaenia lowii TaxID=190385 RepID=UPI002479A510|nr:angiotensin-converting enzyme-like [Uranotaenia lowii]